MAIAIPVFSTQLHRSQDATDVANLRSYFAELQADFLLNGYPDTLPAGGNTITYSDGQTVTLKNLTYTVKKNSDNAGYVITYACSSNASDDGNGHFGGTAAE